MSAGRVPMRHSCPFVGVLEIRSSSPRSKRRATVLALCDGLKARARKIKRVSGNWRAVAVSLEELASAVELLVEEHEALEESGE